LWGLEPAGYHAVNVCLHALAVMLLACVLKRLQAPGAWLAAAIFALHPIEVESVAWITERKNVLSAVFYFSSALAYLRFWEMGDAGEKGRRPVLAYGQALAFFLAALLSKTVTCSLPVALLVVRWWKQGRLRPRDITPLAPFFLLGVGLGLGTAWIEKHHVMAQGADWSLTLAQRCLIAGRALWFYVGKLAWPWRLIFIYPRWEVDAARWWQWLFPLGAAAVVAGLWLGRSRLGRGPLAAVLFFSITLGPALGFVDIYPMRYSFVADHFQYLAGVGLIVAAAVWLRRLPQAVQAAVLLGLGALAWRREMVLGDIETLWRDTIAQNPNSWMPRNNLGFVMAERGHLDEAISLYRTALSVQPDSVEALNNLGAALSDEGRLDEAIQQFDEALRLKPETASAHHNLGLALARKGRLDEAITCFRDALRLDPDYFEAHCNLGYALSQKGEFDEAKSEFHAALKLKPHDAKAHNNLGETLARTGAVREAIKEFRDALQTQPDYPEAQRNLRDALERLATGAAP